MITFRTDDAEVPHDHCDAARLEALFGPAGRRETVLPNAQRLSREGLVDDLRVIAGPMR